jgi:dipeptidyl aminopeptidase/acylaminoacyl peptidase
MIYQKKGGKAVVQPKLVSVLISALICTFMFLGVFLNAASSETKLIPREVIFGNPEKMTARISPDGNMLAYLAPVNNVLNVWMGKIGSKEFKPVTKDDNRGIMRYFWARDNKHIMYLQDVGGNENWRLYGVDLKTGEIKDYTPYEEVQVRIVDISKHFPNELLIGMNKENQKVHDVYHLDLTTGELELVAKNPGMVMGWIVDADFKVRGATQATPDGGVDLMVRDSEDAEWRKLLTWGMEDNYSSSPICFSKDGRHLYLIDSRNANTGRLVKYQTTTGNMEVLAEDPQYDVTDIEIHPDEYKIQAVGFTKARMEWVILDEAIRGDFETIRKLDHGDFGVVSRDDADKTWLVYFDKDNGPISYWVYDRDTQKGTFLFHHRPVLNDYTLATMEPISFESRDGLTINGYITYPPGKGKTNLPMILLVHGGPWARDVWGYTSEAQWLANRGYACLQVNFRGSSGYGKDFLNAGDKEWGAKMQDDLTDAVNWAIKQGIADPKKVAIFGGSYGGYAALAGATFTPDLYACAVDGSGPTNLVTLIKAIPPYWSTMLAMFHQRMGNPETEREFLESRSPLFFVDNIKIPIMVVQGANDPRVPQDEAEQIVNAMQKKGLDYQYMLFEDEGHGLVKPGNRMKFYAEAEKFLAKHLGGRYEEAQE